MSSKLSLYFDTMASTPMDARVIEVMLPLMQDPKACANPSAVTHAHGQYAGELVTAATERAATALDCEPDSLIWTSGASESIQLAIVGAAHAYQRQGRHIITMATEHKATLAVMDRLREEGFEVTLLKPKSSGVLDLSDLKAALRSDTVLVSVMHVNNETGVVQPITKIADCCHKAGALLHVDAAQSLGKLPFSISDLKADLVSLSLHKCYGPKGIGVLYYRQKPTVQLQPQIIGGDQQTVRAGTLATPLIVGAAEAIHVAQAQQATDCSHAKACQTIIRSGLSALPDIYFNTDLENTVPQCCSVYIAGVDISSVLAMCFDIALATGSACNSSTKLPSHVLLAMGFDVHRSHHSLRISYGRLTSLLECHELVARLVQVINQLRCWSPAAAHTAPPDLFGGALEKTTSSYSEGNKRYSCTVWDLFQNLNHLGQMQASDLPLYSACEKTADKQLKLSIAISNDCIQIARAQVLGTPVLMALAEHVCRELKGLMLSELPLFADSLAVGLKKALKLSSSESHLVCLLQHVLHSLIETVSSRE